MSDSRKNSLRSNNGNGLRRTDESLARDTVDTALKYFRPFWGHVAAMERLAPFLVMSARQLRGWTYSETGYTGPSERHTVRMGVVKALRAHADWVEENVVGKVRREADSIECHERQLTLWRDPICSQPTLGKARAA
jgi:hypothetical protein